MSDDEFQSDILKYVTQFSFPLKEKASELQTARGHEEKTNPVFADDSLDDSSSSYCTALCSFSEYSEALEDETETNCPDPPCENASSESSQAIAIKEQTLTNSSCENTDLLQDLKTRQKDSEATSWDLFNRQPQYDQVSAKNPVFIKPFSSSPKITILNLNLINIKAVDDDQDSTPSTMPNQTPWDYSKSKNNAQTNTKPVQNVGFLEHKMTPNKLLIRNQGNNTKYNQERKQEYSDIPEECSTTHSRNTHYNPNTEFILDSGESIISKMKWVEEEQGIGVEKEQPEPSLNTGNRKLPASCTSTLTANKEKSRILQRCFSKRLLVTKNQHQSERPLVSWRLKKQDQQGIVLSTSLPPTLCSSSRQHCSSADNNMAAKAAETTVEVRGVAALEYTQSSCPETNYLDVFNSTCWSSPQSSDGNFYDWSKDVLSFKFPMISMNNNNTSVCSEASSFECIDVALEHNEEVDRNAKTVPKRQIQLKRRDKAESHSSDNYIIPSTPSRTPRDTLQRQHSTPAAFHQDSYESKIKSGKTEQKQKLQKSLSLDETSSKTKMASCIIKNILSKRMQHEQNCHSMDVPNQTFCPINTNGTVNNIDCMSSGTMEECTESNKGNLATVSLLSCRTSSQSPTLKTDSQTTNSIKEHVRVNSKILPKLITKHSFNPLLGGLGRTQFHASGTEIASYSETEKEKLSPSKEANQSGEEKLSCDSAEGKAWNLSEVKSAAVGKQAIVKTKLCQECVSVQAAQKKHYVKDQSIEDQEKPGEQKESTQDSTLSAWQACTLEANTVTNVLTQSAWCNLENDQESKRELKRPGQSIIQNQVKLRAGAPVHVVRDMRSLLKNTYSLSFKGPNEAVQELDNTVTNTAPSSDISKRENKATKQDEKQPTVILPQARDTAMDLVSLDVQCNNTYMKQTTCANMPVETQKLTLTNTTKNKQSADNRNSGCEKYRTFAMNPMQPLSTCLPMESYEQKISCKLSNKECSSEKDCQQIKDLSAKSHSSAGPPACILTVAPATVFPSYFYKPNLIGYQTISPNVGTVSYVQGPILLQAPPHNQLATANGPVPLIKSLSVEGRLSQSCMVESPTVSQQSSKQKENGDTSQKMASTDTQPCTTFITATGVEGIHGGAGMLYPEMAGSQSVSNPQHMLLDPETGQCFYVDMPQVPQRKMLFDPETCQYVEVVIPQQTLSSTVMTTPCAIPFPSLHIPTMYTPHCLSYVQTHHQVLPSPQP